jgi:hypothetical protein
LRELRETVEHAHSLARDRAARLNEHDQWLPPEVDAPAGDGRPLTFRLMDG